MIKVLATNIISPLGETTEQNYQAVKSGSSALSVYDGWRNIPQVFTASLLSDEQSKRLLIDGYTHFESIVIRSVAAALNDSDIDVVSARTILILSTTKANVDELAAEEVFDGNYHSPGRSARRIADYFGFTTEPVVVCNACISGVTAQLLAMRLIDSGEYDNAVVCGGDCQSPFVVAGFMSFKSLSPFECRPFDIERLGLNLGDGAATIIYGKSSGNDESWKLVSGSLNNDAYHVSAPSPQGDGAFRAAVRTLEGYDTESLATVSVHGTATMFNDQMESKAIEKAGLSDVPVSALKGYYGHTLGAAGLIESIITMRAIDDGCVLPVRGYSEIGVSGRINISNEQRATDRKSFVKLISGFGGCNGALLFTKEAAAPDTSHIAKDIRTLHSVKITSSSLMIDGEQADLKYEGKEMLSEIYREYSGDYPKFHKMDIFSRVAFLASELLIRKDDNADSERAIVLFNRSSSIVSDRKHIASYSKEGEFFPSPSVFLYTLPNIVTGEIAIKNGYKGETSLYILDEYNKELMDRIVKCTFSGSGTKTMITGWVDCSSENEFEADLRLLTTNEL